MILNRMESDSTLKRAWNKVVGFFAHFEDPITNTREASNEPQIRRYIDDLDPAGNEGKHAEFVSVCYDSLRGNGDPALQRQVLNTIDWHEEQMILIQPFFKAPSP